MRIFTIYLCISLLLIASGVHAQFPPQVGLTGSTAIHKDDMRFSGWATECMLQRGWQDIADTLLGYTSLGHEASAIGKAGENGVVSLGDGGIATLIFANPIKNGPGHDFAVFENGFLMVGSSLAFLELAFVEVSSDGERFVRFPAISNAQDSLQTAMEGIDASLFHNLAGKYVGGYGTPFDLEDLKDSIGIDISRITHVRVVDVVGSIDDRYASFDVNGRKINDPYATPFPSSGFDLDAVGVIHELSPSYIDGVVAGIPNLSPNPAHSKIVQVSLTEEWFGSELLVCSINGVLMTAGNINQAHFTMDITYLPSGIYCVSMRKASERITFKLVVP